MKWLHAHRRAIAFSSLAVIVGVALLIVFVDPDTTPSAAPPPLPPQTRTPTVVVNTPSDPLGTRASMTQEEEASDDARLGAEHRAEAARREVEQIRSTTTTRPPALPTTQWTVEQRRALRDVAHDMHDIATWPCERLRSELSDPIEADAFGDIVASIADVLATIGADPASAWTVSNISVAPPTGPGARRYCDQWQPRFQVLGDYLLRIAEQGHP